MGILWQLNLQNVTFSRKKVNRKKLKFVTISVIFYRCSDKLLNVCYDRHSLLVYFFILEWCAS